MSLNSSLSEINKAYGAAKSNLVNFRRLFLPLDGDVKSPWYHYEWSDILLNGTTNYAVEGFRQSAKSSIVLRAFPLYCLTFPEKKRQYIVFIMSNQTRASARLKEIADEYITNPLLNLNLKQVKEQSQKAFEVDLYTGITNEDGEREYITVRMEAYGKGSAVRGLNWHDLRPSIVLIDDPQDLEDSLSDTIQSKDWDWFLSDVYNLGKDSRIFMIGNNLGAKCIIEQVASQPESLNFTFMRIPILNDEGESNWAEAFPVEDIHMERDKFSALGKLDIWEREKMCIAISPELAIFKKRYFRYFDLSKFNREDCTVFITMDLAVSQRESADDTVVLVNAVNPQNHWFIIDCVAERMDPSAAIDILFDFVSKYHPVKVGIEKVAFQAAMRHFVEKEMPNRKIYFVIEDLLAKEKKELRIQTALQPRFAQGTIWLPVGAKWANKLEEQLLTFPKGKHDDMIDALAYQDQIAVAPVSSWDDVPDDEIGLAGGL